MFKSHWNFMSMMSGLACWSFRLKIQNTSFSHLNIKFLTVPNCMTNHIYIFSEEENSSLIVIWHSSETNISVSAIRVTCARDMGMSLLATRADKPLHDSDFRFGGFQNGKSRWKKRENYLVTKELIKMIFLWIKVTV